MKKVIVVITGNEIKKEIFLKLEGLGIVLIVNEHPGYDYGSNAAIYWLESVNADRFFFI